MLLALTKRHLIPEDSFAIKSCCRMLQCVHNVDPAILFTSNRAQFHLRFADIQNIQITGTPKIHTLHVPLLNQKVGM
jgi:hypothetical protein